MRAWLYVRWDVVNGRRAMDRTQMTSDENVSVCVCVCVCVY